MMNLSRGKGFLENVKIHNLKKIMTELFYSRNLISYLDFANLIAYLYQTGKQLKL